LEQMLNICVMSSTYFVLGLRNPLMCRVVVPEDPVCRRYHGHSVMIVGTLNCTSISLGGRSILEYDRVWVVLNQNRGADWLGLNPAGLTK